MEEQRFYSRISKGKDILESIIAEEKALEEYQKKNNIKIVDIYRDIHKSVGDERLEYNRLIKDIFEGKVKKLVVIGAERLTRNNEILYKIEHSVELIILGGNGNYTSPKEIEEVQQSLKDFFNERYKKEISVRIKKGLSKSHCKGGESE